MLPFQIVAELISWTCVKSNTLLPQSHSWVLAGSITHTHTHSLATQLRPLKHNHHQKSRGGCYICCSSHTDGRTKSSASREREWESKREQEREREEAVNDSVSVSGMPEQPEKESVGIVSLDGSTGWGWGSLKNYTFTLLSPPPSSGGGSQPVLFNEPWRRAEEKRGTKRKERAELYLKCEAELQKNWATDALHVRFRCYPSSTSPCCQPVNLFCLLPQSLPVSRSNRFCFFSSLFPHVWLDRISVPVPPPSSAVTFPRVTFRRTTVALAFSSPFSSSPPRPPMYSLSITHTAHTAADNAPAGLCWCTTFTRSLSRVYPFIRRWWVPRHLALQLIPLPSQGFLWFHWRPFLTSLCVTLRRRESNPRLSLWPLSWWKTTWEDSLST